MKSSEYRVVGSTTVYIPSKSNEKVPYFVYLLEDENGEKIIRKSHKDYKLGTKVDFKSENKTLRSVGVVGTGLMGSQIAEYLLRYGNNVIIKTRDDSRGERVFSKIKTKISKSFTEEETARSLNNLLITTKYSDLSSCDIIIEASAEEIGVKLEIFKELSDNCDGKTIFATNTSSISIDELSKVSKNPENCIGMHFFNPIERMDLIEVIIGRETSEETKRKIIEFSKDLDKNPIIVNNSPGFIVNRLLLPQINEAILLLEEGVASKEDIDSAVKLGLNHPMGPFQLADFIGLDICLSILEVLSKELSDERIKPANMLYLMVNDGKLGYKSKEGFYKY
ncbi:MAG: 3-hydroxyacyl-CoA dehydrogenase family protein [Methanomicrobiaceae archaeon]|nr:3-hydroxyacyl-CoA dehydrogenase family protein [Methanomicrobiaceae archaeon]